MDNNSEKPYNLLYEVFALGMSAAVGGFLAKNKQEVALICENEMELLAKKFGFSGISFFDKHFTQSK